MTCNDLKRLIVTFWPNKKAKPNTVLESWENFTQTHSFGFVNFSLLNLKELHYPWVRVRPSGLRGRYDLISGDMTLIIVLSLSVTALVKSILCVMFLGICFNLRLVWLDFWLNDVFDWWDFRKRISLIIIWFHRSTYVLSLILGSHSSKYPSLGFQGHVESANKKLAFIRFSRCFE